MKKAVTYILFFVLFTGNLAYTLEAQNSLNNTFIKEKDPIPLKPLFEMFTSSTCSPCVEANEMLNEVFENNPNEYSSISYQMNWPGAGDPYYTEEGGARRIYYGINSVPNLFINADNIAPATSITQEIFDQYTGLMTDMEIEITNAFINENNVVTLEANLTSLANYEAGLTAHMVVVEKKTYNNVGTNGETEFHDVMMKMLPDTSGTELEALSIGSQVLLSETYDMDDTNMETPNDLAVVVFVQDDIDKSVIQSAMADINGSFEVYNITCLIKDANNDPIEGAQVFLENYGVIISDENGQVNYEQILMGTYNYSVNYAGLVPSLGTISVIDEDITLEIIMEHYTSLQETFNAGIPLSWTKYVAAGNFLFPASGKVKFFRFTENEDHVILISPAIEINSSDILTFEYGDISNSPVLSFGIVSDPYDPATYNELESINPGDEWQTYELALNSITASDTVLYFAWTIYCTIESSYHLDNVFIHKEGEACMPIYYYGCSNDESGFTDFAIEQIENYNSNCEDLNGIGYSQYLGLGPASLLPDETYTISMSTGSDNVYASVWIDLNGDYSFTDEEMLVDNFLMENQATLYEIELTIPSNAANGLYLMRARTNGDGLCNDPCEEYYYGEAEDYLILVDAEQLFPPTNLVFELIDEDVVLHWDAPVVGDLVGFNIYYSHDSAAFEVIANTIETTFIHESPGNGLHQYYVTAVYITGESEPSKIVSVLITNTQAQSDIDLKIYPNPAGDIITIECVPEIGSQLKFTVFNVQGCIVMQEKITSGKSIFNVGSLKQGVYYARISNANSRRTIKLLIK